MNGNRMSNEEGNVKDNVDVPLQIPDATFKKRGVSVGSFRMTNGQNIIASENKKMLLNKVISQVDKENSEMENRTPVNCLSPQRNIGDSFSKLLPPLSIDKKTLVLDLDETLVHSSFTTFQSPSDVKIKIDIEGQQYDIHVLIRPGVEEFLASLADKFELIIFTASLSKYADPLMDIIDSKGYCGYRLFREHCTQLGSFYVKDLKRLNRDLKDVIILDNSPMSYSLNRENGFPILSWFEDKTDKELMNIKPILEFLAIVPDVREYLPEMITNNEISYQKALNIMNNYHSFLQFNPLKKNAITIKTEKMVSENRTTSPIGNQIKYIAPKIKASNTNKNALSSKEKPQINIKIINNNITNVIVNNTDNNNNNTINNNDDNNRISLTTGNNNNNNSKTANENSRSTKVNNLKDRNSFRTNAFKTEGNLKGSSNINNATNKNNKKTETKHKKVESFTFGFNKNAFQNNTKIKYDVGHNRQVSASNGLKVSNDHYHSRMIDHSKITDIDNKLKYIKNKKLSLNSKPNTFDVNSNKYRTPSSRLSTSVRIVNKSQGIAGHIIHNTPSNKLIETRSSTNNAFLKKNTFYGLTSYNLNEKINSTRPSTTKNNQFKITKQPPKPSKIKDLKIKYNGPITRRYSSNYRSILNRNKSGKSNNE